MCVFFISTKQKPHRLLFFQAHKENPFHSNYMSKLLHFKINADPKREIGRCLFPDRPPFCFLLGMAYIFLLIVCWLGRKHRRVVLIY